MRLSQCPFIYGQKVLLVSWHINVVSRGCLWQQDVLHKSTSSASQKLPTNKQVPTQDQTEIPKATEIGPPLPPKYATATILGY